MMFELISGRFPRFVIGYDEDDAEERFDVTFSKSGVEIESRSTKRNPVREARDAETHINKSVTDRGGWDQDLIEDFLGWSPLVSAVADLAWRQRDRLGIKAASDDDETEAA